MINLNVKSIKNAVSVDDFVCIHLKEDSNCYANGRPRIYFPAELPVGTTHNLPKYIEGFRRKSPDVDPFPEHDNISIQLSSSNNIVTVIYGAIQGYESIEKNIQDISVEYDEIKPESNVYKTLELKKAV